MNFESVPVPNSEAGAAIARRLNEMRPFHPNGTLFSDGPTGTASLPLPANLRERRGASAAADKSCFRFGSVTVTVGGESVTHAALVCCYYATGGILHHMADFDIEAILPQAPAQGQTPVVTFLCFKLTAGNPSIVAITENDLAAEQNDVANYVRPLYRYEGATLTDDLRNALTIQQVEVA